MAPRTAAARTAERARPTDSQELPDYCARPACRRAFTRVVGPGRPQAFCSEVCRRSAERELRQAKSRLAHFEALVDQMRADVAAFSRTGTPEEADPTAGSSFEARRSALDAVHRVAGVLAFLERSDDPVARELSALHAAVLPVVLAGGDR